MRYRTEWRGNNRRNGTTAAMKRYYVVLITPWYVKDVPTVNDACNIAVAEVGKRVPHYVDVNVGSIACPDCGRMDRAVFLVGGDALVGVLLGLKVHADSEKGAVRVAKSILGKCINTNLQVVNVSEVGE